MNDSYRRNIILTVVMGAVWVALLGYLGYVQIGQGRFYEAEARRQHWSRLELLAPRGRIFDRQGRPLVLNRTCASIRILPQYIGSAGGPGGRRDSVKVEELAGLLATFGLASKQVAREELWRRNRLFWFKRGLDYTLAESLRSALVRGQFVNCTYVDDDAQRDYPHGEVCATVVGFVGEERGLAGLEAQYDSILRGRRGWALLQRDAVGRSYPYPSYPVEPAQAGADIRLTLDTDIQYICFAALREQVQLTGALKAAAVVLDAQTGAILGLCDYPSYDPVRYRNFPKERYLCTALFDQFEPGSSFKIVVCAAALESPNADRLTRQSYDVSAGFIQIGKWKIKDVHPNGVLGFDDIFVKSSNPGCALLSMQIEPQLFYDVARGLGFGSPVGCGLPGEGAGSIDRPEQLTTLRLANIAFGQGLTVTLLQLASAYMCIANDGAYLRPYLIASITSGTRTLSSFRPTVVRQVLRPETARRMKDILERVVLEGTGTQAKIDGVSVCGKTGTAQKTEGRGYSQTRSRMTFVGFFPKQRPRYVVAVLIDEPRSVRFAGATACPAFRAIGERLLLLERMRERDDRIGRPNSFHGVSCSWGQLFVVS